MDNINDNKKTSPKLFGNFNEETYLSNNKERKPLDNVETCPKCNSISNVTELSGKQNTICSNCGYSGPLSTFRKDFNLD